MTNQRGRFEFSWISHHIIGNSIISETTSESHMCHSLYSCSPSVCVVRVRWGKLPRDNDPGAFPWVWEAIHWTCRCPCLDEGWWYRVQITSIIRRLWSCHCLTLTELSHCLFFADFCKNPRIEVLSPHRKIYRPTMRPKMKKVKVSPPFFALFPQEVVLMSRMVHNNSAVWFHLSVSVLSFLVQQWKKKRCNSSQVWQRSHGAGAKQRYQFGPGRTTFSSFGL